MRSIRQTIFFVLTPIAVVMLGAALWYQQYGYAQAERAAMQQLDSAAELVSQLIGRHVEQVDQALDSIVVQGHLQQYHMYSQVGLLDEAEDARLYVEQALERLAAVDRDVQRIECYAPDGGRFIAVVNGRRDLRPTSVKEEPWFANVLEQGNYLGFLSAGRLRLAESRKADHADAPIAVVSIVFDFGGAAAEATTFATRHLSDVHVSIVDADGATRFHHGVSHQDEKVLRQAAPLEGFGATVLVEQTEVAALSEYYLSRNVLFGALAIVTVGLLGVAAFGTQSVVKDFRRANRRVDTANRELTQHAEKLEAAHRALEIQTKALQSEQELLKQLFAVQERDRELIAYEIHDGIVQYATGSVMLLEACMGDHNDKTTARNLQMTAEQMRKIIEEGRRLMNGLRPPVLDESGVVEAIGELLVDIEAHTGLRVVFDHDVRFDRLDPRLEGAIFRIVQEALNNVRRHGKTDHAAVQMIQRNGLLEVAVRDQGVGFDLQNVRLESFGLRGIRERARLFGGDAKIESEPGEGTVVLVTLPTQAA